MRCLSMGHTTLHDAAPPYLSYADTIVFAHRLHCRLSYHGPELGIRLELVASVLASSGLPEDFGCFKQLLKANLFG